MASFHLLFQLATVTWRQRNRFGMRSSKSPWGLRLEAHREKLEIAGEKAKIYANFEITSEKVYFFFNPLLFEC